MTDMVDMAMDDEDQLDYPRPMEMPIPRFPCGLIISLRKEELDKLGLAADCDVGDKISFNIECAVTGVHKSEDNECVTLQIEEMGHATDQEED